MSVFVILVVAYLVSNLQFAKEGTIHEDYLGKDQCNVIKGIFTLMIFFSHAGQYVKYNEAYDSIWMDLIAHTGQLVVVMFLFYSGYGIMESVKKKKGSYVKGFIKNRFLPVFLDFAIAIIGFIVLNLILGIRYDTKTILLSFTGWTSIGNSNWYMFTIFVLYLLTFICFIPILISYNKGTRLIGIVLLSTAVVLLVFLEMKLALGSWWYNTMIVFPCGMWYSLSKEKIDAWIHKTPWVYWIALTAAVMGQFVVSCKADDHIWMNWTLRPVVFALLVLLITMKVRISSDAFAYMGKHLFSLFILQRLPMIALTKYGVAQYHRYYFLIICFIATIILSFLFEWVTRNVKKIILK